MEWIRNIKLHRTQVVMPISRLRLDVLHSLFLIGSFPFIVTRAGKRKEKDGNSEKEYVETSHKEAVHRIVDTNQRYRAYIEQSNDKGYNLVVVGTNGYWTGNFPDEEHAHRFAYENGIELD